ncbi:MAG: hypothetical protein LBC69_01265 [Eubacteriaceae bacterium]|jgi:hypothetical protein|nr:hypothetical protein [Eubacteriaceae bacterium]
MAAKRFALYFALTLAAIVLLSSFESDMYIMDAHHSSLSSEALFERLSTP